MKIYLLMCGPHDYNKVKLVTTDYSKVCEFISNHLGNNLDSFDRFTKMECWENEKLSYFYSATFYKHLLMDYTNKDMIITAEDIDKDIQKNNNK